MVQFTDKPGLGIELNRDALERYSDENTLAACEIAASGLAYAAVN
jgi:hypothetical protein